MEPERWAKIERVYHDALAQERSRRAEFVERACAGDEPLCRDVLSLLEHSEEAGEFMEAPAMQLAARALAASGENAATYSMPAAIGRYRIVRLLGEGGMGAVYEAEQENPRRSVALKVIRPGLATPERLRRFKHESQALGRLQHAGIAQIYEASTADTGFGPQPFFAMELIRGQPLDVYAGAHRLSTRSKLELVARICDAVHHAHQRGLIHRDLKPGNILVDEAGQPKILDFGVARITESDAQATQHTELGQIVGTLAYMSPEQVAGDQLEVDTRSDVYSLGVVLYELLSGRLPFAVHGRQLHEAVHAIREEEPTSLSSVSRNYRGDIETIVGRALEKDKARRYASAADLAGDIRHYLNDEPIVARPPSTTYQLRKFARRHRALVAGTAVVFVVLVAGVAASTWQAVRAVRAGQAAIEARDRAVQAEARTRQERDRATSAEEAARRQRDVALDAKQTATLEKNRALSEKQRADEQAATALAVSNFLQNDLLAQAGGRGQARAGAKPDPDLKVRTALDRAAKRIEGKFEKQPLVAASIRRTIGMAYAELGVYPEAERQLERSIELRRRVLGDDQPETLVAMRTLAGLYHREGRMAESEALFGKVLQAQQRVIGRDHRDTLETAEDLGVLYIAEGKNAPAETLLQKALDTRRRVVGAEDPDTLGTASRLGCLLEAEGRYAQAAPVLTSTLDSQRRVLGNDHLDTLLTNSCLAFLYWAQGKYAQAEPLMTGALEIQRRELGPDNVETLYTQSNLAVLYNLEGKYAEAEPLFVKTLDVQRRTLGPEHPTTVLTMQNLAVLYREEGRFKDAEPLMIQTLELRRRLSGEDDANTLATMNNLASLYCGEERYADAEPLFARVAGIRRRLLGEENRKTLLSMSNLSGIYQLLGRYAEAEPIAVKTLEISTRTIGPEDDRTVVSMNNLGVLYRCEGKYGEAETLLTKALEIRRRINGPEHPDTLGVICDLATLRQRQGRYDEADALFASVLDSRRRVLGPTHPDTTDVMAALGEVRLQEKRYADAEAVLRDVLAIYAKSSSDSWQRYRSESLLGANLAAQGRFAEAEAPAVEGYRGMVRKQAGIAFEERPGIERAAARIVQLYESWGKPDQAAEWRKRVGQTAQHSAQVTQ